jgi:hypothetical protein
MTPSEAFTLSLAPFMTTPALFMLSAQHTAFRVHWLHHDLARGHKRPRFHGRLRSARFRTPIVVTNGLAFDIAAFQMLSLSAFCVPARRTACFAFNEPFAYPAMKVRGTDFSASISLVDYIRLAKLEDTAVFASTRRNRMGNRSLIFRAAVSAL